MKNRILLNLHWALPSNYSGRFFVLLFLLGAVVSCENDSLPDVEAVPYESTYVGELNKDEIQRKIELYHAIVKFNEANKDMLPGDIDLSYAKEIKFEGVHSYTLRLETSEPDKLVNIVFVEKEGIVQADYVSFYIFSEEEMTKSYGIAIRYNTYRPLTTYKKRDEEIQTFYDGELDTVYLTSSEYVEDQNSGGSSNGGGGNGDYYAPTFPTNGGGSSGKGSSGGKNAKVVTAPVYNFDKVIIDPSFKDNDCLMDIYNKMGGSATFDMYLKKFDKEMSVADLILKAAPSSEFRKPTVNAKTNRSGNKLTITFNSDNLGRPSLSVARTMAHEMIHAEMYRILIKNVSDIKNKKLNFTLSDIEKNKDDFVTILDYYDSYGKNMSEAQHALMAENYKQYRDIIAEIIGEFDYYKNPKQLYQDMAWIGLYETSTWKFKNETEKRRIKSSIANYEVKQENCKS